jgi:hypothetical protein
MATFKTIENINHTDIAEHPFPLAGKAVHRMRIRWPIVLYGVDLSNEGQVDFAFGAGGQWLITLDPIRLTTEFGTLPLIFVVRNLGPLWIGSFARFQPSKRHAKFGKLHSSLQVELLDTRCKAFWKEKKAGARDGGLMFWFVV